MMSSKRYSFAELVANESFIRWVKTPDPAGDEAWRQYLLRFPDQHAVVAEARKVVLSIEIRDDHPSDAAYLRIWSNIAGQTSGDDAPAVRPQRHSAPIWWAAAAVWLVLCIASIWFFARKTGAEIGTDYGESRTVVLPDNTFVTLNSNSSIRYDPAAFREGDREVFVEGEAFFSVARSGKRKFIVTTPDLGVTVLGTRFSVSRRRESTRVILEEGKVRLDIPSQSQPHAVYMTPGEMIEYSSERDVMVRERVDPEDELAWRENELRFVGAPLTEIAHVLEDNYGYSVRFADPALAAKKFTGSFKRDDVGLLLQTIGKVFAFDVVVSGDTIVIDKLDKN